LLLVPLALELTEEVDDVARAELALEVSGVSTGWLRRGKARSRSSMTSSAVLGS
jgi:hypothetical protein